MRQNSRLGIVALIIVALVISGLVRDQITRSKAHLLPHGAARSGSQSLARMNSYALALLLGGLRGPLVMILWSTSETQKSERQLEDFDTKVEWIRLLQPEFDSVHIFQVWNKAYNISVQMASLANKYTTILDAIDYAKRVDQERPNNINTLTSIAQIYFDKLGNSTEKDYYRARVRAESLPHATRDGLKAGDPGYRIFQHDQLLDDQGNVLAPLLKPALEPPANLPAGSEYFDGSELQFLAPIQPFKYGLSTFGIAYNYHKRSQILQSVGKQEHAQLSDLVVDSRPALALKNWSEDEWLQARRAEITAFNLTVPVERFDMEKPTADLPPTATPLRPELISQAIFGYELGARLAEMSLAEYDRHLKSYLLNAATYNSHVDGLRGQTHILRADVAYLQLLSETDPAQRARLIQTAREQYGLASLAFARIILRYYTDEEIATAIFPPGANRADVQRIPDDFVLPMVAASLQLLDARGADSMDQFAEDRPEYQNYLTRAQNRLAKLADLK